MDNSNLYCSVHFEYDKEVPVLMQKLYQDLFMIERNMAIEELNPNYEIWNKEFDESGLDRDQYNGFMRDKQREILMAFNERHYPYTQGRLVLDSDDECDIFGYIPKYDAKMHMSIKLINEKEYMEYIRTH